MVKSPPSRSYRIIRRISLILLRVIIILLLLTVIGLFLLQTAPVQNYGRQKIQAWLENRLHTKVVIGGLSVDFPKNILLKNLYLEDLHRDTLLSAGNLNLDVNLWALFRHKIVVNNLRMDQWTIHIERKFPDSNFNYAFVIRAFAPDPANPKKTVEGKSPWSFELGNIQLSNIHAHYLDDAGGNELNFFLSELQTNIKTFDPGNLVFAAPAFSIHGLNGSLRHYQPTLVLQKEISGPSPPIHLKLNKIGIDSSAFVYSDERTAAGMRFDIGMLSMLANSVDLSNLKFDLKSMVLNHTAFQMVNGKAPVQKQILKADTGSSSSWMVNVGQLNIADDEFSLDDNDSKPIPNAVDYAHLFIRNLNSSLGSLVLSSDMYKANIHSLSFSEKSGFELKSLSAAVFYSDQQASLKDLVMLTNNTRLKNQTQLSYASTASLAEKPGDLSADLSFDHSDIGMKDLYLIVPSLRSRLQKIQNEKININGRIRGKLNNLDIPALQIAGLQQTHLEISGQISGLPDAKKAIWHVQIKNLSTSVRDLSPFLSENVIPKNIHIPETLSAQGRFDGSFDKFHIDMTTNSAFGTAAVQGTLDIPGKQYDLTTDLTQFDLGKLLKQDSLLGQVDLHATAKGNGFDLKSMHTVAQVNIPAAMLNGYHYQNLSMNITLENGLYQLSSAVRDPNLQWQLNAKGEWTEKFPSLLLDMKMDTINLLALHLMKDSLTMSFKLNTNLSNTNPDSLDGKIYLSALAMHYRNAYMSTDSIYLQSGRKDSIQSLLLRSEMADLDWIGKYKLTEISQALQQAIDHYYHFPGFIPQAISPQNWQMNLMVRPSPFVLAYNPSLAGSDSIQLNMALNSMQKHFRLSLLAPSVHYEKQFVNDLSATAETKDSMLNYSVQLGSAKWAGLDLYGSAMYGSLVNNTFRNSILLNDAKDKARYRLATLFTGMPNGWKLSLLPDSLLLDYDAWKSSADNFIQYDSSGLSVNHLLIDHGNQSLLISSSSPSPRSPIAVSFNHFSIKSLTSFAGQDSLLLDGEVNGRSEIRNILSNPTFTSNLTVDHLAYDKDTLGTLTVLIDNQQPNIFSNHLSLEGNENDARVSGTYDTKQKKMDMAVDIAKLDLLLVKLFSAGQIKDIRGKLKGNLHASGSLEQPLLTGHLHFDSAFITPFLSGERLKLSTDSIQFDNEGISFHQFSFLDSAGHEAVLDGRLYTKDYRHFRSDLSFNAKNFIVVNTPVQTNRNFYGKLNMDLGLQVKGDFNAPDVTGNMRVNKQTDFTLVLPNSDPELVSRQGVVLFVDKNHPIDTARIRTYLDSLNRNAGFRGVTAMANIETDSSAQFTMIVNERTGDALSVKGRASLSGAMNANGKMSLTGTYVLEEGDYNLSLRLLKRKFDLQRGSTITWTGDPTGATIDITATYLCNTSPISLVGSQMSGMSQQEINELNQKLPFQVNLKMQGLLLKPKIIFSITLPASQAALWQNVESKLNELNSNAAEVNKQVFALLLFNTFISQNPFESTSGGNSSAALMASQSASSILTNQLNALAGGFAKKIDLSMNVNSDQSYNTSGQAVNQTALQLGVSKNLFGDRVKVTVGSDFQLSGASQGPNASNIAGNVKIDYTLTPDGKYIIRVYSMNQYNTVVEGQVVETGASFIITLDFDSFNELFQKKNKQ